MTPSSLSELPAEAREVLTELIEALQTVVGAELRSVLLFGSGAEGRLRPTSDINLLVLAASLTAAQLDALRTALHAARSAAGVTVLFLESAELSDASELFAMKFGDIKARHRVLVGDDPFANLVIPRDASIRRLRQVLLNLKLRLRERYVLDGDQSERLSLLLADMTGPIRVAAAALLSLRDGLIRAPKEALLEFAADSRWTRCLDQLSAVHRGDVFPLEATRTLAVDVSELLGALGSAAGALK